MTTLYVVAALAVALCALLAHRAMTARTVSYWTGKEVRTHRTYKPGKCALCWGSGKLEWLYQPPNGRGLHACTRCAGTGRGAGVFGRAPA